MELWMVIMVKGFVGSWVLGMLIWLFSMAMVDVWKKKKVGRQRTWYGYARCLNILSWEEDFQEINGSNTIK